MKSNDWDECLESGNKGEQIFINTFKGVFHPVLKQLDYKLFKTEQKQGKDIQLETKDATFEVKSRDYYWYKSKDILVEIISVVENNTPGWIYKIQSEYLVYAWFNNSKTKFVGGCILYLPCFKKYFFDNIDKFVQPRDAKTERNGVVVWRTRNKIVPIDMIPKSCIQHINTKTISIKDQLLLSDYFEFETQQSTLNI